MSLTTSSSIIQYNGNDVTINFAFPYYFLDNEHLVVTPIDEDGEEGDALILNTDYTVSGAGIAAGGTVTMVVAPATGTKLNIARVVPITQLVDYVVDDNFPAETHEQALDKLTMICQMLKEHIIRMPRLSLAHNTTITEISVGGSSLWMPVLAVVEDGERRVIRVVDWTGGLGVKPAVPQYLGSTGYVTLIAQATDIRGDQGGQGEPGEDGATTAEVIAALTEEQILSKLTTGGIQTLLNLTEETIAVCDEGSEQNRVMLTRVPA